MFRLKLSSHDAQLHVKPASKCHLLGKVPQVISGLVYVTMKICYEGFNHLLSRKRILEGRDLRVFKISRCSVTISRNCPIRFGQGASLSIVQARWHCALLACARDVTPHIHVAHLCIIERCLVPGITPRIKLITFDASSCAPSSRSLSLCDLFSRGQGCVLLPSPIITSPLWANILSQNSQ